MRTKFWIAALLGFAVLAGCARKPAPPAVVNGEVISQETLDAQVKERLRMHERDAAGVDSASMREAVLNQLIDERLILQAAVKQGITPDEDLVAQEFSNAKSSYADEATFTAALAERGLTAESFTQRIRERNLISRFVDSLVGEREISDESLREHFASLKTPPNMPERVKMRFIQITGKEKAEEIADRIREAGKNGFDTVADELVGTDGMIVSEANWVQPGTFSLKMAELVRGLGKGEWAGPVETSVAMYLVKVYDREEPRPKTFEEARDEMEMIMVSRLREDAVNAWLATERPKATIVKNTGK